MRHRLILAMAAALATWSCTRQVGVLPPEKRPARSSTAVATVMRRQAVNAVDAGDGDLKVRELRRKLVAEPDNLNARLELAKHYEQAGYPELAMDHYRLAAERAPDNAAVQVAMARLLRSQGLKGEAMAGLSRFLEGRPEHRDLAAAWSWLGILRDETGALAPAEQAHRQAVKLRPDDDGLHNNLGYNLLLQGKHAEAAEEFRRALQIRPGSEVARNNLGIALASQPKEAVLNWQSVSDPATAHNNLAAVLIEQGRYEEARRELNVALGYKRDLPAALRNLQLVSGLDGRPAAVPVRSGDSWLKRFGRAFGSVVLGMEAPKAGGARPGASE